MLPQFVPAARPLPGSRRTRAGAARYHAGPITVKNPVPSRESQPAIELSAVIVGIAADEPQVLVVPPATGALEALPSGPLESAHRTLEAGLRSWVERQTGQMLGYVEQLYTFGDRNRTRQGRTLSIGYLALVRELKPARHAGAAWRSAYRYFPWEDWRAGRPPALAQIDSQLRRWIADAASAAERRLREERVRATFALGGRPWNEERVLERYELLYEARLVAEAWRDARQTPPAASALLPGAPMGSDHRRILATGLGRLRSKLKYRPVLFDLTPGLFTLSELQAAAEAVSGLTLHKQNFRRGVERTGLVEPTGQLSSTTGGRPAELFRFKGVDPQTGAAPGLSLPAQR